jgi:hypothetical protein
MELIVRPGADGRQTDSIMVRPNNVRSGDRTIGLDPDPFIAENLAPQELWLARLMA